MTDPAGAPVAVPHCYRHPGRETYVRCSRCDRPICPDCMTSASVGFQCPECVAEGRADVRTPVTVAGGAAISRPTVTLVLIGMNVAVFALDAVGVVTDMTSRYSMWPVGIAGNGDLYRLATAPFLHANILHIAMNMLGLYFLGPSLERLFGHARFAVLYLVAALGGSVASYLFSAPMVASVGASGAVFGLMGAWVVAGRRYGYDITPALILIAVNVVLGFTASGLDWRAHLGGLVTGAVVAGIFAYAPATSRTLWQILGVLAVLGVIVLLTMWRTAALRSLLVTDLPLGALGAVGGLLEGSSSAVHAAIVLPLLLG